ncbi:MAG: beta-N-acetylhexosaminidase [Clostridia bacterium]|nr:beta-N-acetylhexosaminidase [Clostridia bacterium]MDD4375774.1 beta-N-acetylhexosaminidase [Clostridia bacterium]
MDIKELSMQEKIGQMIIIGIPGAEIDCLTKQLITEGKVGGVILYRKNIVSVSQLLNLINGLKKLNEKNKVPLFISIDQEGGRVNRMPVEIHNLRSARKISNLGKDFCYKSGYVIGKMLKEIGINMNFAPVLDIGSVRNNSHLGDRCVGLDAKTVSENGASIMKGLKDNNIISVIKHFPGHGTGRIDSHIMSPIIYKNLNKLKYEDMVPFIYSMNNGADAIMVGHLIVSSLNSIHPASLSKQVISNIVRKELKYDGLVITDDLSMKSVELMFGITRASIRAIKAGADIIMINKAHRNKIKIINRIYTAIKRGFINNERIDESVSRILKIKEEYQIKDDYIEDFNVKDINKLIDEINSKVDNTN